MTSSQELRKISDRILTGMAWSRHRWVNEMESEIQPILEHSYEIILMKKNGGTEYIDHWESENRTFFAKLNKAAGHKTYGFKNRKLAFEQVITEMRENDHDYMTEAINKVTKILNGLKYNLAKSDADEVWKTIRDFVELKL